MTMPTAPGQPVCSLGVSERTLSALRDGSVSRAEADHLATHVVTCGACGARLADLTHEQTPAAPRRHPP